LVISLRDVSYFFQVSFKPLVDTVGYSTQTSCLLQILLKPLNLVIEKNGDYKQHMIVWMNPGNEQVHAVIGLPIRRKVA